MVRIIYAAAILTATIATAFPQGGPILGPGPVVGAFNGYFDTQCQELDAAYTSFPGSCHAVPDFSVYVKSGAGKQAELFYDDSCSDSAGMVAFDVCVDTSNIGSIKF